MLWGPLDEGLGWPRAAGRVPDGAVNVTVTVLLIHCHCTRHSTPLGRIPRNRAESNLKTGSRNEEEKSENQV